MTMAPPMLQEEGWPLGLQLVNVREGLLHGRDRELISGRSVSLNTLITASPNHSASTDSSSSSDLDSESTGSFFHERSMTFGTLIGASSTLDLSKRSSRTRRSLRHTGNSNTATINRKRRSRPSLLWSFSVCCRDSRDVEVVKNYGSAPGGAPTLNHFLAGERRKPDGRWRRRQLSPGECFGPYDGLGLTGLTPEWNTLFVDGRIAPPPHPPPARSSPWSGSDGDRGRRSSVIFSWICVRNS